MSNTQQANTSQGKEFSRSSIISICKMTLKMDEKLAKEENRGEFYNGWWSGRIEILQELLDQLENLFRGLIDMSSVVTADLSQFGYRELVEAAKLLTAYAEQGASDFLDSEITLNFNINSGFVFLSDSNYNVAMLNGENIEQWFNCPYCGHEGFLEDMKHAPENSECTEYLTQIGVIADAEV